MSDSKGTIEAIGTALGRLFNPLEERLSEGQVRLLMNELGMQFPPELETKTGFTNALKTTIATAKAIPEGITALAEAVKNENIGEIISKGVGLINHIITISQNIDNVAKELKNVGALPGINPADLTTFANQLPAKLVDFLVVRNLEGVQGLAEVLEFLTAIEREDKTAGGLQYVERKVTIDKFSQFIQAPGEKLKAMYKWGGDDFTGLELFKKAEKFLIANGFPSILDTSGPLPVLDALFVEVSPKTDINPKGIEIKMTEPIKVDNSTPFVKDDFTVEFLFNGQFNPGVTIVIQPNGKVVFKSAAKIEGNTGVRFTAGKSNGEPYLILGQAGGSRLEAGQFMVEGGVGFVWDSAKNEANGVFKISGDVKGGKLVVDFSQGDGFLSNILSGISLESNFDLGLGFSSKEGIFFNGSATLEIQLPSHINLGVIEINALTFIVGIQDGKFPVGLAANIKANLGPLQAVVEQIGVKAFLSLPPDQKGNAGPVNFEIGFQPPKGVGLSLDAGPVKGGGYLYFDFDREEYAGILQLDISGFVTINAIGLITTKMPDGSKGFSLLVIMTVEFNPGIQLSFGFTFLGIGGLLGLNRTVKLEVLAQGIRSGTLSNIMFPQGDIIANAPRIISDLRAIFPPEEGKFLVGPMVKLGWGTPTLISVAVGVIIEIPGNFAIVGIFKVALPTEDAALIIIQVAFIGAVEFDKERLWFFASMYDSRVLFITLEGEMGLLVAWGAEANFVVSVGGFHPRFTPPPLPFPSPRRIALDLSNNPAYRVRIEGYFAVTSNTVQFGARAELGFGLPDFGINGHISFDALFQFSPFYFIVEISGSVRLTVFGFDAFSIRLEFSLEGPTPYRAKGSGYISILFWEFSADFDVTWGESRDTSLPPIDVMKKVLKPEFEKIENWKAELPAGSNLLVSLRGLDATKDQLVLHPVGVLRITQRAIPLGLVLDKVGSQKPEKANKFTVAVDTVNLGVKGETDELFAMAQFKNMKNDEKLSLPAFQPNPGGVDISVSGAQLKTSRTVVRKVRYELITIDSNYKRHVRRFFEFTGALFYHFMRGSAITESVLSQAYQAQRKPYAEAVEVLNDKYVVAFNTNNAAIDVKTFPNELLAQDYMNTKIASNPGLSDQLHVISQFESISAS